MIFKLKWSDQYTIFLHEFITKIIFISKHFNYNIYFLNIVSIRWRPLLKHSRKHFWKFCITRCSMLGETAATSSLMFCFKSAVVLGFFCTPCSWDIPRGRSIATRDTHSDEYWGADEISTESQARCSIYQRSMATEMLWVLPEGRSRTNSLC
jgi:hypothetical protein